MHNDIHHAGSKPEEGVIKFDLEHRTGPLPAGTDTAAMRRWFGICRALDLIGRHADRYGGAAYGNISQRESGGFLVTGTQTGGRDSLGDEDLAWVTTCDSRTNRVVSRGPSAPSSESLTHGQVYSHLPQVGFVIHVHSPLIWHHAAALGLSETAPEVAYGTPEMAAEVEYLLNRPKTAGHGVFAMGGHEDGIVAFGATPEQTGQRLLHLYRQACEFRP